MKIVSLLEESKARKVSVCIFVLILKISIGIYDDDVLLLNLGVKDSWFFKDKFVEIRLSQNIK